MAFVTILVLGFITYPLLKYYKLTVESHQPGNAPVPRDAERYKQATHHWFTSRDRKYLIPFFRKKNAADPVQTASPSSPSSSSNIPKSESLLGVGQYDSSQNTEREMEVIEHSDIEMDEEEL